jgi:hypothetical protein
VRAFKTHGSKGAPSGIRGFAGSATAASDGSWTVTFDTALPDGQCVSATQTSGGTSEVNQPARATPDDTVPCDETAPIVTIDDGPADGSTTNDSTPTFEFSSVDAGDTYECRFDSENFAPCSDSTGSAGDHTPGTPLSDGEHTFRVRATDAVGNTGTPESITFTVDTDSPATLITSGPGNGSTTGDPTPTFGFSSEAGTTFQCRFDSAGFGPCSNSTGPNGSHTPGSPLPDGSHTFRVRATDEADNTGPAVSRSITVDTTPPNTTINSGPANGSTTGDSTPTFGFSGGSTFQCRVDGGSFAGCTSPRTVGPLGDGQHTFQVRARDPVGNTDPSPASRTFTVDTTAPPPDGDDILPSNDFEIVGLKKKKLTLDVPGPGTVEVTDAAEANARRVTAAAKKRLKPSSATATAAGEVTVKLKLNRKAKKKLKEKGKVKVNAAITFTPTGGTANTETAKLKVKKKKK